MKRRKYLQGVKNKIIMITYKKQSKSVNILYYLYKTKTWKTGKE